MHNNRPISPLMTFLMALPLVPSIMTKSDREKADSYKIKNKQTHGSFNGHGPALPGYHYNEKGVLIRDVVKKCNLKDLGAHGNHGQVRRLWSSVMEGKKL